MEFGDQMSKHNLIFCDSEVYAKDWIFCFEFLDGRRISIKNDAEKLKKFVRENTDNIFVGYNFRQYDQWILKGICCGINPKFINDKIIFNDVKGWTLLRDYYPPKILFFDAMTEFIGLKKLEGHMGVSIVETTIPFTINRKLSE